MAPREAELRLACDACGHELSWPVVRGMTTEGGRGELFCPACGSRIDGVDAPTPNRA